MVKRRVLEYERVKARHKLAETEKQLSGVLYERGVDDKGFAIIRSKGDQALFHLNTSMLKRRLGAPAKRAVADLCTMGNWIIGSTILMTTLVG